VRISSKLSLALRTNPIRYDSNTTRNNGGLNRLEILPKWPSQYSRSERVFSGAKHTLAPERIRLGAEMLGMTECLKSWVSMAPGRQRASAKWCIGKPPVYR
jgi:hypothetical protein